MKVYKEKKLGAVAGLFYSLVLWLGTVTLTVFFTLVDIFLALPVSLVLDRDARRLPHKVTNLWARGIIAWNPIWRLTVTGQSNIRKGKNYVIVANHQSLLDILAVAAALPLNFKFLAKKELFSIPFLGWAMSCAGYIPVDRSSHESGRRAMKRIQSLLAKKLSVLLFPEGTRSPDGKIHAFKTGAFKLARENKTEILPVVIDGTGRALPKKSLILRNRSRFVVSIGEPVCLENLGDQSLEEARDKIRHEMAGRLERLRRNRR
ncbi:MAG TPA: lysophospholipid acyltransferase family protein [Candidatus Omnitrophota bacterium]|nr:lysophospholipid acyltransferase family protein [Candidatus Omnitrophota bacterium]